MDVKPGGVIADKFSIERRLGGDKGRSLVVARQLQFNRLVAIEVMAPGTSEKRVAMRFARAAQIASSHVPAFIDIGALPDKRPYIVLEYLDGMSLHRLLAGKRVAIGEAVDYILQACDAVAGAHAVGLLHRRLTPASLFRTMRDGAPCIKVLHFTDMPSRAAEGSPPDDADLNEYMAPEVFDNSAVVDRRCDVWALGVILYELLTGARPFTARSLAKLAKQVRDESPNAPRALRPEIPEPLEQAVLHCLEKSVAARWHTVAELAQALAPFATGLTRDIPARLAKSQPFREEDATLERGALTVPVPPLEHRIDSLNISDERIAVAAPADDSGSGSDIGFRKMMADGRIEKLSDDGVVGAVRAKRIASDALALAKQGPRTSVPQEEEAEMKAISIAPPAPSKPAKSAPDTPAASAEATELSIVVVDATEEGRRKTLGVLILMIAVITGLLVGLVVKLLRAR